MTVVPAHVLLLFAQQSAVEVWSREETIGAVVRTSVGLATAFVVWRLVRHVPWPRPFRLQFVLTHIVAAPVLAFAWLAISQLIGSFLITGRIAADIRSLNENLFVGVICYVLVAGPSYAAYASARAARSEAITARTQLAALRAQLHPHFLFNALHTVVQLIPVDPGRAMDAAELVADLLRSSLEEQRDEVELRDEWSFVSRYLSVEQIRFGDRLVVRSDIPSELLDDRVPSFALQTLVENAVLHGAAPRVAPTEIVISAVSGTSGLTLSVRNSGDAEHAAGDAGIGTGLARLRERLAVLYGGAARVTAGPREGGGFESVLVIPRVRAQTA